MIRLTWLQFRTQAVTAAAALAAFAVLLAATGPHLASLYAARRARQLPRRSCRAWPDTSTGSLVRRPLLGCCT